MRVYISGAITGKADYMENFERAQKKLEADGYQVFNPARLPSVTGNITYEEYMKLDIELLSLCDGIYMLFDWQESKGANREFGFALGKDMIIMFEGKEREDE